VRSASSWLLVALLAGCGGGGGRIELDEGSFALADATTVTDPILGEATLIVMNVADVCAALVDPEQRVPIDGDLLFRFAIGEALPDAVNPDPDAQANLYDPAQSVNEYIVTYYAEFGEGFLDMTTLDDGTQEARFEASLAYRDAFGDDVGALPIDPIAVSGTVSVRPCP
jgi:hypothetical protein